MNRKALLALIMLFSFSASAGGMDGVVGFCRSFSVGTFLRDAPSTLFYGLFSFICKRIPVVWRSDLKKNEDQQKKYVEEVVDDKFLSLTTQLNGFSSKIDILNNLVSLFKGNIKEFTEQQNRTHKENEGKIANLKEVSNQLLESLSATKKQVATAKKTLEQEKQSFDQQASEVSNRISGQCEENETKYNTLKNDIELAAKEQAREIEEYERVRKEEHKKLMATIDTLKQSSVESVYCKQAVVDIEAFD